MSNLCACGAAAGITHVCPVVARCWCGCPIGITHAHFVSPPPTFTPTGIVWLQMSVLMFVCGRQVATTAP